MEYNISGPEGNAYAILGQVQTWARQCWPDNWREKSAAIRNDAMSGDYENLLKVVEKAFNGSVKFVRDVDEDDDDYYDDE